MAVELCTLLRNDEDVSVPLSQYYYSNGVQSNQWPITARYEGDFEGHNAV